MAASVSFHQTKTLKARACGTDSGRNGSEWVDLTFIDTYGNEMEFTAFFERRGEAQIYADAINQAHAVVEPPDADEITEAA